MITSSLITAEAKNNCTVVCSLMTVYDDVVYMYSLPNMFLLIA